MIRSTATYALFCALVFGALLRPAFGAGARVAGAAGGGDVLCIDGLQNDTLVCAGTALNGIYRSTDGGVTWQQSYARDGAVSAILADPLNAARLFAGTSLGLRVSIDGGRHWQTADAAFRPLSLISTASAPRVLLAADGSSLRRSDDNGVTWTEIGQPEHYGITHLVSVRTDTGAIIFAADSTTVLLGSVKNIGVWTPLPALPVAGGSMPRISSLLFDTLSLDGARVLAGTSAGVYAYSFRTARWVRFGTGLPDGRIGTLGIIVYDTTAASRSYSYCAAIGQLPGDAAADRGVYKLSSLSGVIVSSGAWIKISDEQVNVRACFMPARGPNRAKIYLATADGVRVSYDDGTTWVREPLDVYPIASLAAMRYNAGIVRTGEKITVPIRIGNAGGQPLTAGSFMLSDAKNFTLLPRTDPLVIGPLQSDSVMVQFVPDGIGKFTTTCSFTTNDPMLARVSAEISGFCAGYRTVSRTVVIDRTHSPADDIPSLYSDLSRAFRLAGMSVIDSLPAAPSSHIVMVVLPGPKLLFTAQECAALAALADSGAAIVALGSAADQSAIILNALFGQPQWKTASGTGVSVRFRTDTAASASGPITAARSDAARSFAFLAHADTLAFASATRLALNGSDTLYIARGANGTAILGSAARIGRGKIIAFGDSRFWANSTADAWQTGLWAADNFSCALSIAGTVERVTVRLADTTAAEKYMLFSVPYALADNSVETALKSLGPQNPYNWRLFGHWDEKTKEYVDYAKEPFTIDRGQGYWLITKGRNALTLGTADYSVIPEPFTIALKPGFTLIGDPFPFTIDWNRSKKPESVENSVWEYDGSDCGRTDSLRPFKGYYVYNDSDSDAVVTLYPEPVGAVPGFGKTARASVSAGGGEWSMRVSATDGAVSDTENYFGMLSSAAAKKDINDFAEPPRSPGRFVALSFAADGRHDLAGDYRAVANGGGFWDCSVRASEPNARISLQTAQVSPLPAGYGVYILDRATERVTDCTQSSAYEFTFGKNEAMRSLRILVGEQKFIEQHTDGVPLTPLAYGLEQNYPNPWNPSTTIRYTLAHSGMVELDIFNVLGQKIRSLVQRQQPIGVYEERWAGTDDGGIGVPSGVYFYRLKTPEFVQSKRMVLVR